ncbi:MAG: aminoacyl-histidine dipeptidase [uncultured bacterium (gcode 4)]|uniref:Aminoacyl-histidine dipeptidase n=1 Tax=uncultured bacterium (gcode 4) TaxID=1234023 RepID=K2FW06_9BACT|nr:MAG: aminoacyl-histidine dipeptidase [uncultured bacterium (gcode 4)]
MSKTIENFKEISKYPRQSWKEWKIRDFLVSWALSKWLEYKIDKVWNLIVYVEATADKILSKTVILQSHMDMVCVKTENSSHDFDSDPIEIIEENWFLRAKDTSLWADNWVWIALSMSSVEFESHPPLELIFTVDEEMWMSWALWLDCNLLSWKRIINLDSENENEICISSAWWARLEISKKLDYKVSKFPQYKIDIKWMKWWHSWVEIDKNHWNAVEIFMEFFKTYGFSYEIGLIKSWTASNVITSQIEAVIWIPNIDIFKSLFKTYLETVKQKYDCSDISFNILKEESNLKVIEDVDLLIESILNVKVWVYKMSNKIPDLVETSANLWILKIDDSWLRLNYSLRSSVNADLKVLIEKFKKIFEDLNYLVEIKEPYPGWQDDPEWELVTLASEEIRNVIWMKPEIIAVHAWLECWAIVAWLWIWAHAISIWANLFDIHSIKEKASVASIENMEKILENILKKI